MEKATKRTMLEANSHDHTYAIGRAGRAMLASTNTNDTLSVLHTFNKNI